MTLPFELMREIEVSSSDTTTKIQYDAKIAIVGSDPVTLTLDQGTYKGCTITIKNRNTEQATIIVGEDNQKNIGLNKSLVLEWDGTTWIDTTLIIDSTISEDSHNPVSSVAVYQKANEIAQTVTNETNARNEAIAEEQQLREAANTAIEQQINGEAEDRKNSDSYLFNKIKSTNNSIGQLESLKTTDKSSTVAAINEVYDKVQQGESTGNTATNCEQFTYVVDSDLALADWIYNDRDKGQDYTSVLIRKGEWTSDVGVGVNLTRAGTKAVVGEIGSKLIFNDTENALFYDTLPLTNDYYMHNVLVEATLITSSTQNRGIFLNIRNLKNCSGKIINSGCTDGFVYKGCQNLIQCTSVTESTIVALNHHGFLDCNNLLYCKYEGIINVPSDTTKINSSRIFGFNRCKSICYCEGDGNANGGTSEQCYIFYSCKRISNSSAKASSTGNIGIGFNGCNMVFLCWASGNCKSDVFSNCYASNSNTDDYACADTPAGGFNNTTNPE